jgi:plastocyanin
MLHRSLLTLAVALAVLAAATGGNAATHKLSGTTGPGFTITLKSAGKAVKTLKAGSYTIVVADKSSIHNFHVFGPGVNKKTTVPFVGTKTWTVRLKPGKYTFQCDIHAAVGMKGTFRVKS